MLTLRGFCSGAWPDFPPQPTAAMPSAKTRAFAVTRASLLMATPPRHRPVRGRGRRGALTVGITWQAGGFSKRTDRSVLLNSINGSRRPFVKPLPEKLWPQGWRAGKAAVDRG